MSKQRNDSTAGTKAIVYQFLVALEKCFELEEEESIFIETFGDVTISSLGFNSEQIEVKDFSDNLTSLHKNFWNTLLNWLDISFDVSMYKHLFLHTTQPFSKQSKLVNWNKKDLKQKKKILIDINLQHKAKKKKSVETTNLLSKVLNSKNRIKLDDILSKLIILDSQLKDTMLWEKIKQKHIKCLLVNRDECIEALLGFIINPKFSSNKTGWQITYTSFHTKFYSLNQKLNSKTVCFPDALSDYKISKIESRTFDDYLFVKKIKEIDLIDKIEQAKTDFIKTRKLVTDDFSNYKVFNDDIKKYEDDIFRIYKSEFDSRLLDVDNKNYIKKSKQFYLSITSKTPLPFRNFNDTKLYFRNGLLHEIANDENDDEKFLVWKLENSNE